MEDIIHLLPDVVANQIAAGEVVQRPSSVIKEMVENSIDAGASKIQVLVVDGGKQNIQVVDDGKGMSETDARLAFERHATSKIQKAEDLFNLSTMGFRGEALASIAAVAQVELKTRREEDELGTYVQISGAKMDSQEPIVCAVGSNFSVKNLFFNVPARRKFLKSNQTELTNVVADFQRIVLVHPHINFELYNNGVEMFNLPKASTRQRIIDVFGKKINADLLPVDVETSLVSITGYVSKPESSKKKGTHEFFFVNGRYMRHPYFHSAVMHAYEKLIPAGEHVSYFLYFSVQPSSIDVNVHPTKTEIKFDNEQSIWQVLSAAVKETLGKFCNVPMIDFDVEGKPDIPAFGAIDSIPYQPKPITTSFNPFSTSTPKYQRSSQWEALYKASLETASGKKDASTLDMPTEQESDLFGPSNTSSNDRIASDLFAGNAESVVESSLFDFSMPKFQYKGRFVVYPDKDGIYLVDQHRAHVRILFEQNLQSMKSHPRPTQKVLFPEIVNFDRGETVALEEAMEDIHALGFELTNLGGGSYSVSGTPIGIEGVNIDTLLHEMVSKVLGRTGHLRDEAQEALALSLAKASAIVRGQVLTNAEMDKLVQDLFSTSSPARTPDGKVIYSVVTFPLIEKMF